MNQNKKILSLVYIFIALVILVFFTKNALYELHTQYDEKQNIVAELETKKQELENLNILQQKIKSGNAGELSRYFFEFNEVDVLNYIYGYLQGTNGETGVALVKELNFQEGVTNEYGFKEGTINVDLRVSDEKSMIKFLDYVMSKDSKYKFFIESFNFPNDGVPGAFNIKIPLKVYYK